ncbi:MAG: MYXO-CTERM sorting domain-containing protein [Kofleriaceae bacterium]
MSSFAVSLVSLVSFGLVSSAQADSKQPTHQGHPMGNGGYCGTPDASPVLRSAPHHHASNVIFLDRCVGGCTFTGASTHDAKNDKVAIQGTSVGSTYSFTEFKNYAGEGGAAADAEWNAILECTRKVYSYYNTTVTDVKPTTGTYHRSVLTGLATQLIVDADNSLLGISDVDCSGPIDNMSSFSFSESQRPFSSSSANFVRDLCVTVTHEAGHAFGLEHEFEFTDGKSACNDPMSYDTGNCNPPNHYFRNKPARCGGFELMECSCTSQGQNSHLKLNAVFGPGAPTIAPPIATITTPAAGGSVGAVIIGSAGHERGVEFVEFYVNDFKWAVVQGALFVPRAGQPNPSPYTFQLPAEMPGGVMDIKIRAYDDLGNFTESPITTATKGAPCATADNCAEGQKCEAGKCFWDQPVGVAGQECTFDQFCVSNVCAGEEGSQICTTTCIPGVADSCESGFECVGTGNLGFCLLPEEGGCCSTSNDSAPWAPLLLGASILGFVVVRRRRSR